MIFLNRQKTVSNNELIKDPTQYWYVEKYVYGVLKETIEVPLGTGIKFEAIESGYDDDVFYGWSSSNTSVSRTFSDTTLYADTLTAIKNNLDENNTLKIYAIYYYNTITTASLGGKILSTDVGTNYANRSYEYLVIDSGTLTLSGYIENKVETFSSGKTTSSTTSYSASTITLYRQNKPQNYSVNTNSGSSLSIPVQKQDRLLFNISGGVSVNINSSGNGTVIYTSQYTSLAGVLCYNLTSRKYRVESHTV